MKKEHRRTVLNTILLILILLLFAQAELFAIRQPLKDGKDVYLPSGIISVSSKYVILVEKSSQKLLLYRINGYDIELISTYKCSTGKNQGDKIKSGDRRTPEGVYFFNKIYTDNQLAQRYGVMAFVLDFPSYLDKIEGKGGNGIWLHGMDKPLLLYDSKGCIQLKNDDILEINNYVKLYETPIIIEEKVTYRTLQESKREREEIIGFLTNWENSWEEKELELYLKCYSSDKFRSADWNQWKNHKQSLNNIYKFIDIDIRNINILKHDKTITISFLQDYESDRFHSLGFKKLFVERNSGNLKIIGEDWTKAPSLNSISNNIISEERKLRRFLNKWIASWESKKINVYMDCYSRHFASQNMGWKQWKKYKSEINKDNKIINVSVLKPKINIDNTNATVTYIQKYISDSYTDYGLKRLQLNNENGAWKIITEAWEPI